jgi:hypothetical protein
MTNRDLGEVGIKLIGAYFAASAAIALMRAVTSFAMPSIEGISPMTLGLLSLLPILAALAVAAGCLGLGRRLASLIFKEESAPVAGVSRRDLLTVGLALVGVGSVVAAVAAIVQFGGTVIWYSESSRQSQLPAVMDRSWRSLATSVPELIAAVALIVMAGKLGSALDRRYSATSGSGRDEG